MGIGLIWLAAFVVLVVIETMTLEFTCLSFAIGCLIAAGLAGAGLPLLPQLIGAGLGAALSLVVLAPILRHRLTPAKTHTAKDAIVGSEAMVLEDIEPPLQGKVRLNGVTWQATSTRPLSAGTPVIITELSGTLLEVVARDDVSPQRQTGPLAASEPLRPQTPQTQQEPLT